MQNEPWTVPVSPGLLDRVRICKDAGKEPGRGVDRLLESRWSSTSEVNEEMEEGMTPDSEVEDKSLYMMNQITMKGTTLLVALTGASTSPEGKWIGRAARADCSSSARSQSCKRRQYNVFWTNLKTYRFCNDEFVMLDGMLLPI